MVGPFGGITAATMLAAAEGHSDRIGDPLALTVNYAAPIADGDFDQSAQVWTRDGGLLATTHQIVYFKG